MGRKLLLALAVVVLAVGLVAGAATVGSAQTTEAQATLIGYEEVPAVSTAASGDFRATIDEAAQRIRYRLQYSNLEAPATGAHIHFGQRDVVGGVSAFLCGGGDKPACPSPGGVVTGVIDPSDIIGPEAQGIAPGEFGELVAAMKAGVTYANVHSEKFPTGEIRGQIRTS
ncbi:MAG TPA: CHRD domain-containing protein [Actinomycetota bacterium]|nr:CHRD domain-containing protein [Actinomycetota bacterium]